MLKALFGTFILAVGLIIAANNHAATQAEAAITPAQTAKLAETRTAAARRSRDEADVIWEASKVKTRVAKVMRDPNSLRWGSVARGKAGAWCGSVSGKNGFGAYTGPQAFVLTADNTVIMADLTVAKWRKYCD